MMRPVLSALICTIALVGPQASVAGGLKLGKGSSSFAAKLAVLDGRAADQYAGSVRLKPDYDPEAKDESGDIPAWQGGYSGPYLAMAKEAARKHNVPEDLFLRLIQQESGFNQAALSIKGAIGLAQLMPETAAYLGVDPNDAAQNLEGGAKYLRMQFDKFGSWKLALAAYNAGPEAVEAANGVPDYEETQGYVAAILGT